MCNSLYMKINKPTTKTLQFFYFFAWFFSVPPDLLADNKKTDFTQPPRTEAV